MEKKRRENLNFEKIDLVKKHSTLKSYISQEIKREERCGLLRVEYLVLPEFGKGRIIEFYFEGVVLSINDFVFNQDFIFYNEIEINALFLSFLIRGEMLLQLKNVTNEKPYEDNESIITYIKRFNGTIKIYNNKPFKEIRIKVSSDFLSKYNLKEVNQLKKMTDKNFILPITHQIFSVLEALETQYGEGLVQRIFLEAKVLEIIALQIENYKSLKTNKSNLINQKPLKKIFELKQFLNENLDKNYSVLELSRQTGLSENIIKSEFKRVFKCTVSQYFLSQKMKNAKQLLKNTELPIYQIAEDVGYKNATHFSAAFKRFYNKTPKAYRAEV
ncbi:AraC family transcriptional regulator [Flaviramulus sp. BrNp1-15]|uniref:helix-turn-helix domain-containing protein n=1 Tax=Flaviramulus sp. BrNp1-15 TaxID=2916754 RepID=UPI001EE91984|nr:AraC family transcriptional regulator [Flaviramulus sp. BrNp1-15]ULC59003.1 AraC family transcriptional regulator [Flaviramulus sp. BrNp1-15]